MLQTAYFLVRRQTIKLTEGYTLFLGTIVSKFYKGQFCK